MSVVKFGKWVGNDEIRVGARTPLASSLLLDTNTNTNTKIAHTYNWGCSYLQLYTCAALRVIICDS